MHTIKNTLAQNELWINRKTGQKAIIREVVEEYNPRFFHNVIIFTDGTTNKVYSCRMFDFLNEFQHEGSMAA